MALHKHTNKELRQEALRRISKKGKVRFVTPSDPNPSFGKKK